MKFLHRLIAGQVSMIVSLIIYIIGAEVTDFSIRLYEARVFLVEGLRL